MKLNLVGAFIRNKPFGTEIAFEKGLRAYGHDVETFDPDHGGTYSEAADATIIFKWLDNELREDFRKLPGKKIVYQPDDIRFPHIRQMMQSMRDVCDCSLTYDDEAARIAKEELGYKESRKLLLTADPGLYYHDPGVTKDIDACFIGSMGSGPNHVSRIRMLQELQTQNKFPLRLAVAHDVYNISLINNVYNRSKIILNHATDVGQPFGKGYGLQCRHFEAGMTGACLLSNEIIGPRDLNSFETFSSMDELFEKIQQLLSDSNKRNELSAAMHKEIFDKHLPIHRAIELTQFISGLS